MVSAILKKGSHRQQRLRNTVVVQTQVSGCHKLNYTGTPSRSKASADRDECRLAASCRSKRPWLSAIGWSTLCVAFANRWPPVSVWTEQQRSSSTDGRRCSTSLVISYFLSGRRYWPPAGVSRNQLSEGLGTGATLAKCNARKSAKLENATQHADNACM